ncbi:MAG TPA: SDR family NAD(P)-dependent oxidoreductase [Gaiellaceae bacterium]|nr:SDR family NAD(P)-dependent oxidoreductase [Gaiellaceae bacterium]
MRFEGRTAVVTGAAQGIGAGIARRLASEGAAVALLDVADCAESAAVVEAAGARTIALRCDVRLPADLERAVDQAEAALGTATLAVAAAGVIRTAPFLELREEDWDLTLEVNLKGTAFLLQTVARRMVAAGLHGSMVALSSVAAKAPRPTAADYSASKLAVISVCRSAAAALAPHGITVNAVCPGVVDTPMTQALHEQRSRLTGTPPEESLRQMVEAIPLGRIETVDDVADAALFLLSEEGSYITGQSLNVCGGLEFD